MAPAGFVEEAVRENVIAGPAMLRRAAYMYGGLLPTDPQGLVGSGLGRTLPRNGESGMIAPTDDITTTGEERVIDGVRIVFQMTPGTEAPAEMNFFFPELRALCMAENCTCVMHNLYTPRGAHIRDGLAWSKYIHEALRIYAPEADLCFASHNWPVWGTDAIAEYLRTQRDTYRYLHDQTMRLANTGLTSIEIAEQLELPAEPGRELQQPGLLRDGQSQRQGDVPEVPGLVRRQPGQPRAAPARGQQPPLRRDDGRGRRGRGQGRGRRSTRGSTAGSPSW